jgi:hypothetical protein
MEDKLTLTITDPASRLVAQEFIANVPAGVLVRISKPTRSELQSEKFHAICTALAKSDVIWPPKTGKRRTKDEWKFLLVSATTIAKGRKGELVPGLEYERVCLVPATSTMSVAEMSDCIEYGLMFCAKNLVQVKD